MIKVKSLLTAVVAFLTATAYNGNANKAANSDSKPNMDMVTDSSKTLIVYFSKRGVLLTKATRK